MSVRRICLIALASAALTGGKLALAALPNIEIVTLLLVVYALVFGWRDTITACLIFIFFEILIWGFMLWWIILYLIYWPALVSAVALIPKNKYRVYFAAVIGLLFTACFGILSTFIEIIFVTSLSNPRFWTYFYFRYAAGFPFFITHVICNTVTLFFVAPVLYKSLLSLYARYNKNS